MGEGNIVYKDGLVKEITTEITTLEKNKVVNFWVTVVDVKIT